MYCLYSIVFRLPFEPVQWSFFIFESDTIIITLCYKNAFVCSTTINDRKLQIQNIIFLLLSC